ncbi:hypothetical protein A5819_000930 [Enterococcus sp. 7E2_DIV0204]|uniref:DUF1310 family protein n=1 Tax=unclassified Enterococcus TaxID=2608891 RepID=UPI000A344F72|nr:MULTISPECIES: DUF1310 family protein [unclassified Enterococcus]OTN88449.1 hypothetical protein A5819_000930 [Enterococcus sp. 7E2_DIV0204]OTP50922.1 hypothetical protein A5884_000108 [Enterococcus sp. 7D2_DIV0200]
MTKRKFIVRVVGIVLIIILGIGGKVYMDNKRFKDEMLNVVNSGQAKQVYEKTLKNADSKALTSDGIIKSYKVDYDSVKHNPMGGIMLKLIINDDNQLYIRVTLDQKENGRLTNSSGGGSMPLEDMLEKENMNND